MDNPLVSIIIPAYNRANLISETLNSVLAQTYSNWECIVVDDGSDDNTKEIVQRYVDKDPRFILADRPDTHKSGGNGARNYGFQISKGEYIQWLDSDDLLDKEKLKEQLVSLKDQPETTISFSSYYTFNSDINTARISDLACYKDYDDQNDYIRYYCLKGYGFYTGCLMLHKTLVKETGGWNEDLLINQDGEFIIKAAIHARKIVFSDKAKVYYRMDSSGKMKSSFKEKAWLSFKSIKSISDNIQINTEFPDKSTYCATLFVHLKFLYPDHKEIWEKADREIKQLGGKHFYIQDDPLFNFAWKTFGLKSAFFYRRAKNYLRKHATKSFQKTPA